MGAIKPWHLVTLFGCFVVVAAIVVAIVVLLVQRRK